MAFRMPETLVVIGLGYGEQLQVKTAKTKEAILDLFRCTPDEEVVIPSVHELEVYADQRGEKMLFIQRNEEIRFFRREVKWYSIWEIVPPSKLVAPPSGLTVM